jgi:hypothetical protein
MTLADSPAKSIRVKAEAPSFVFLGADSAETLT